MKFFAASPTSSATFAVSPLAAALSNVSRNPLPMSEYATVPGMIPKAVVIK